MKFHKVVLWRVNIKIETKMKKFIAQCIGTLLIPVLIQAYFYFSQQSVTKEDINHYVSQSRIIFVDDIQFIGERQLSIYKITFRGLNPKTYYKRSHLTYSPILNKYFSLENYDFPATSFPTRSSQIYLMINQLEMQSPDYGNQEQPVPVFFFYTNPKYKNHYITDGYDVLPNSENATLMRKKDPAYQEIIKKFNYVPDNMQYIKNVHEYLAYEKE